MAMDGVGGFDGFGGFGGFDGCGGWTESSNPERPNEAVLAAKLCGFFSSFLVPRSPSSSSFLALP